jgi:hypothetical protein
MVPHICHPLADVGIAGRVPQVPLGLAPQHFLPLLVCRSEGSAVAVFRVFNLQSEIKTLK